MLQGAPDPCAPPQTLPPSCLRPQSCIQGHEGPWHQPCPMASDLSQGPELFARQEAAVAGRVLAT